MKITPHLVQLSAFFLLFTACKKETAPINNMSSVVAVPDNSLSKTDGIITVQTAILPPVTPQSFITAGDVSVTRFDITTSRRIFIYQLFFSATYPEIQSITINNFGSQPNAGGVITYNGSGPYVNGGSGIALLTQTNYISIDSSISGKTTQLKLARIVYRTDDEVFHDFYTENAGDAQVMCLVYNIPHLIFKNPADNTLKNGFRQIATVKVSGDTAYTITDLPLHLSSPFTGSIPKAALIVKNGSDIVGLTDSVELNGYSTAETVIHFAGKFKHIAGNKETLKIFAPVSGFNDIILTSMSTGAFVWTDGLGARFSGGKNRKFYKEQPGQAVFH